MEKKHTNLISHFKSLFSTTNKLRVQFSLPENSITKTVKLSWLFEIYLNEICGIFECNM